ncbi:MAG TPA: ATP-binding protein [Steroidobacteraceae bacterium]|nr:ATP-binding protein [Steroidobacteraceae bacterium]
MHSLSRRLLVSVSLPLALFSGVMIWVLDSGFRALSERSLEELLDRQMVALIASVEPQPDGGYAPAPQTLDTRLATPRSGLYAQIRSPHHLWRSPSTAGLTSDFGPLLERGGRRVSFASFGRQHRVAIESRAIQFADDPKEPQGFTFSVALSLTPYEEQLSSFRQQLSGWFIGLTVLLLAVLAVLLRWVLAPVRRMEREIHEVEEGRSDTIGSGYPRELSGVAVNLNALLTGERRRLARYRDTLGNLAHSLKTPLAVMRATLPGEAQRGSIGAEIDRMSGIIEHQMKRAATSGGALIGQAPVDLAPVASELRAALLRVYAHKDLSLELEVAPGSLFVGDRGDVTEMLGNLLDNACKWCRSRVRLGTRIDEGASARQRLVVTVEDDGSGIAPEDRPRVLQRGVRADENVPGHGLGLAMVRETVDLYGGALEVDESPLAGARFTLRLPGR